MSGAPADRGAAALNALLSARFAQIADADFSEAVVLLALKQLMAPKPKATDLRGLRDAIGAELFDTALQSLTTYRLRVLARRLDKKAPPGDTATSDEVLAHIQRILGPAPEAVKPEAPEPEPATIEAEAAAPVTKNSYFGRKAFRAGD